jgi:hypothetical protein
MPTPRSTMAGPWESAYGVSARPLGRRGVEALLSLSQASLTTICGALVTAGLLATAEAASLPEPEASYVADAVLNQGADTIKMRVYHDKGRERLEMDLDGRSQITILRPDLGLAYLVVPKRNAYYEMLLEDVGPMALPSATGHYEVEQEATEIIEGEKTTKYRVLGTDSVGGSADFVVWSTADGIYMRIEGRYAIGGESLDFSIYKSNVKREKLDPALFTVPAGAENSDSAPAFVDDQGALGGTD